MPLMTSTSSVSAPPVLPLDVRDILTELRLRLSKEHTLPVWANSHRTGLIQGYKEAIALLEPLDVR